MTSATRFEVVTTRSGRRAVRDALSGELMHPVVGPAVESERLYVNPSRLAARLAEPSEAPLVVLDVGLGAGSNAVGAWRLSESRSSGARRLTIVSFDQTLDALALAARSEHASDFALDGAAGDAVRSILERAVHETARTTWRYVSGDLPDTLANEPARSADVVYWDPFSPRANPALWNVHAFAAVQRLCRERSTLHTYSGATAVRTAMLLAGFFVGIGEPTGENKFATCAADDLADLVEPLDARWLDRVTRSSAPFPSDAPVDALDRLRAHAQFRAAASAAGR